MFQIEHRQGVEPVFAFNVCCIALNASLCLSLEHVCRGHKYQMAKTHKTYSLRDSCIITDKFPYLTKMRICHIKEWNMHVQGGVH